MILFKEEKPKPVRMPVSGSAISTTLSFLSLLLLLSSSLEAQTSTISGQVLEAKTNIPLPGVNVYISGTSLGASTDSVGKFSFTTELTGKLNVVASFLGFKNEAKQVEILNSKDFELNFNLTETLFQMNEVQVSAKKDKEWQELYEDFRRFFIGWDSFADELEVVNPTSIDFKRINPNEVMVTFREPIQINNYALGYHITIELDNIRFNPYNHTGFWNVYPRYEEMDDSKGSGLKKKWSTNRKKAYLGSSRHFFISLVNQNLKRDKFVVQPRRSVLAKVVSEELIRESFPLNWRTIYKDFHVYTATNYNFGVAYKPELTRLGKLAPHVKLSSFKANNASNMVVVDDYGNVFNSQQVLFLGPWSEDRFSKSLPLNYRP